MGARRSLLTLAILGTAFVPEVAHAQACPDRIPDDARLRRDQAKEWFGRAEAAEQAGRPTEAVKAYDCSLRMVPHAFTAYNLGKAAEKAGDLEMAVIGFSTYLKLAPEADDRVEVERQILALQERIDAVRRAALAPPVPVAPPPSKDLLEEERPSRDSTRTSDTEVTVEVEGPSLMGVREWVVAGVGLAALAGGVFFNLKARSKMSECRDLADEYEDGGSQDSALRAAADAACDAAKAPAYVSYGLFGAALAAVVLDVVFIATKSSVPVSTAGFVPLPGGGALVAGGRF